MDTKAIEEIKQIIEANEKIGRVVVWTLEGLASMPIEEIIKQPTEGLLYDLNRDKVTVWTNMKDDKWVNDYACALVITALKSRLAKAEFVIEQIDEMDNAGQYPDVAMQAIAREYLGNKSEIMK